MADDTIKSQLEQIENLKTLKELTEALNGENKNLPQLTELQTAELQKQIQVTQEIIKLQQEDIVNANKRITINSTLLKHEKDVQKQRELQAQIAKDELDKQKRILDLMIIEGETADDQIKKQKELVDLAEKEAQKAEQLVKLNQKVAEAKQKALDLGIQLVNNVWGKLVNLGQQFFDEVMNTQLVLSKFGKPDLLDATKYDPLNSQLRLAGMGMKEAAEATMALDKNFVGFENSSQKTKDGLRLLTGELHNMGVDMNLTAENFGKFSRGLNMGAEGAVNSLKNIRFAAIQAGVSPQKAFADLNANLDRLSGSGAKSVKIFEDLMKKSRELGVEVGKMLDIVGTSFDTFEGAADKAGKLNAILGGDFLNSVEMLNATEEQRVDILRKSFEQSGKNFDSLDRYTKKSIMAIMGFKSEAEAQMMLGKVSAEQKLKLLEEQKAQEQLDKAKQGSVETTRLLTLAFYDLMKEIKPFAEDFRKLIEDIAKGDSWLSFFTKNIKGVVVVVGALKLALVGFSIWNFIRQFQAAGAILKGTSVVAPQAGASISSALVAIGGAGKAAFVGLAGLALVILAIGGAIGLASMGLAKMVKAFAELKDISQIAGGIIAIGVAIYFMGSALLALIPGVIALATASGATIGPLAGLALVFLGFGGAVALAAGGVGYMAGKFAEMFKEITVEKVNSLFVIAAGIMAIGGAMAFNVFRLNNFIGLMKDVVAGINEIKTDDKEFISKVEILKTIGQSVEVTNKAKISDFQPAINVAKAAAVSQTTSTTNTVNTTKEIIQSQQINKQSENDALVKALTEAIKPLMESNKQIKIDASQPVQIKLNNGSVLTGNMLLSLVGFGPKT